MLKFDPSKKSIKKPEFEFYLESYIPFLKNQNMIETISFDSIKKSLEESSNQTIVLHGPPGVGKTSHALHFSHQVKERNNWIVRWFNSDTKERFLVDLLAFTDLIREKIDHNKTFEYLIQLIGVEFKKNAAKKFLIVLDNLNDFEWIESFFTNSPKNVFIIATTTKRNVFNKINATEILVEYFDENQARALFYKRYNEARKLSNDEVILLEKYFQYDKVLP